MGRKLTTILGGRFCLLPVILFLIIMAWFLFPSYPQAVSLTEDTDNNGIKESYTLNRGQLTVVEGSRQLWQSPGSWEIRQILLADADNQGQKELIMVVWKEGSFGSAKPFWLKAEDNTYSCHLFMYRLISGKLHPVWCSSALDAPIEELEAADLDKDGIIELKVHEKHNTITYWQWQEWGFARCSSGYSVLQRDVLLVTQCIGVQLHQKSSAASVTRRTSRCNNTAVTEERNL
ncbi:MAG: hypothetical protein ACOX0E_07055 [Syntrophomonadaceae bacterium]|jgi:hypothetical protein